MSFLKDLPLSSKLRTTIMAASGGALVLASAAFVAYDYVASRAAARNRLEVLAQVAANQSRVALDFNNRPVAEQALQRFSADRQIVGARLFKDGLPFADYLREGAPPETLPSAPLPGGMRSEGGHLSLTHPVQGTNEGAGVLYLRSHLQEAADRLKMNVLMVGGIMAGLALLTWATSLRLSRIVTGPIARLAETVRRVGADRDYSVRAVKTSRDELGTLIDGFNDMLSQIQVRDGALQLARTELELRVDERTAQLQFLNEELKGEVAERKRAEAAVRESEERYRQLVELSPDAILIHSEGRIVYANSAALSLFGAPSAGDLIDKPILDLVSPETREEVAVRIQKVYEGGVRTPLYEERFLRLDGSPVDIEVAAISFSYGGKPAAQVILRDITHRKEVDRMKNEFISTVSHELRTPLTSIQGSLGLVANGVLGPLPPSARSMVEIAHKNCQRLVLLINDILDVEKMAAGKMKFSMKPLEIMPLLENAVESNRGYAEQYGVGLAIGPALPGASVMGDPDRLIQVFTNLLSNAAKFSPMGGTVTVSVSRRDGSVRVAVADRGPGIPVEFRGRIFQKFSQADSSDVRQKGGTGLGLAISRMIVDEHHGRVGFETETGKGTTFFVDLPEHADRSAAPPAPPADAAPRRVLVCEDDPQVAAYLRMLLGREGIEADVAPSASEAVRMLEERAYDAMTLDLSLSDRDGLALLEELRGRERTRDLPVVVVSAESSSRPLSGALLTAADWLDKPIDGPRLFSALRAAAARGSARVLHVEPDPEVRRLVAFTLRTAASVTGAAGIAEAAAALEKDGYDLVILNTELPDGASLASRLNGPGLPRAGSRGGPRTPLVPFNPRKPATGGTLVLASALVKTLAAQPELPEAIRRLVGRAAPPGQGERP